MFIALVLALGITCPSSVFASVEEGVDVLSEASGAQEQSIVLDTTQNTKQIPDEGSEALETPSGEVAEPSLDTPIEPEKNKPEETTGMTAGQEPAAELPALTGYVFISGSTKVGATLSATVEGAPRSATLNYQWYRGTDPISGATSTTYTTTNADDDCDISCRVTATGYEGILISGSIKPALPMLTGSVVIVNVSSPDGVEVGDTLAATLNGVQADALLHCQWYRGDTAIEGATSTNYVLVNTDVGQSITCRVTAENYRGVLISSALILNDQLVTVEYWAYTDASPDREVIVHTETVRLGDVFNYRFDQNKDDDPSNDYVGYRCLGWVDEWGLEFYDITVPPGECITTLEDIANMLEWDGVSPLRMYAYMDMRSIEVIYEAGVYEDKADFDKVRFIPWNCTPYLSGLSLAGYEMLYQIDEYGDELDTSMTCEYILTELLDDPWADTLYVYIDWTLIEYRVHYIYPNGTSDSIGMRYEGELSLPSEGAGFDYPGHEFVGWFTEPDGAGTQVFPGMRYCNIVLNDEVTECNLYACFRQLELEGNIAIVGEANVGKSLSAVVSGMPSDVQLRYQWYRDDALIEGATSPTYVPVRADGQKNLTCKVSDVNYAGILVSDAIGPIVHIVMVEYWSYTDVSPSELVIVHSEQANVLDIFNHKFDQNKDDDPLNDLVGYQHRGWFDEWTFEYYDSSISEDEFTMTIEQIADLVEWDGLSNIVMYAAMDPRIIKVTYEAGDYGECNPFQSVRFLSWYESPYYSGLGWGQHRLVNQTDELGHEITPETTCEYILTKLLNDKWSDALTIHINWEKLVYTVHYVYPNDIQTSQDVEFSDALNLPVDGPGFDYPGYQFIGWFTEQNGSGKKVLSGDTFSSLVSSDLIQEVWLYAYFVPVTLRLAVC